MKQRQGHQRVIAAITNNGRLVHLAPRGSSRALCGAGGGDLNQVHARVTCRRCAAKRPLTAARFATRPLVVGLNWEPLYEAMRRALEAGAPEPPKVKVPCWPVLG